jgi:hypothetical protein
MFPQVDALPNTQGTLSTSNRQGQIVSAEDGPDVGRHVIRAFVGVIKQWITVSDQSCHVAIEVTANIGVGVFTEYQRGTGVLQKYMTQAGCYPGQAYLLAYGVANALRATPARFERQFSLEDHECLPLVIASLADGLPVQANLVKLQVNLKS